MVIFCPSLPQFFNQLGQLGFVPLLYTLRSKWFVLLDSFIYTVVENFKKSFMSYWSLVNGCYIVTEMVDCKYSMPEIRAWVPINHVFFTFCYIINWCPKYFTWSHKNMKIKKKINLWDWFLSPLTIQPSFYKGNMSIFRHILVQITSHFHFR